jgi:hypothetical protein
MSLYEYVQGRPLRYIDTTGEEAADTASGNYDAGDLSDKDLSDTKKDLEARKDKAREDGNEELEEWLWEKVEEVNEEISERTDGGSEDDLCCEDGIVKGVRVLGVEYRPVAYKMSKKSQNEAISAKKNVGNLQKAGAVVNVAGGAVQGTRQLAEAAADNAPGGSDSAVEYIKKNIKTPIRKVAQIDIWVEVAYEKCNYQEGEGEWVSKTGWWRCRPPKHRSEMYLDDFGNIFANLPYCQNQAKKHDWSKEK